MQSKTTERYFFFGLLFLTLFFTFLVFRPFLIVLVLGASFAIVLSPINKWLKKNGLSEKLSALLTVVFFIILICGPILGIGIIVFNQSQHVYSIVTDSQRVMPFIEHANTTINGFLPSGVSFDLGKKSADFVALITNNVAKIFSTTLSTVFSFILMILAIFYFLKDGHEWKKYIMALSPMSDSDDQKIITKLKQTVNGVLRGYLLIALLQGLLMGLGMAIFGIPHPALWAVVAAIASMIPSVGTALVSIPAIIFLYATGHTFESLGFLAWAVVMVGMIDNFLSPLIVSKSVKIPEFLVLFSILGGVALLGPVGVLVGPLAISLLYSLVSIYQKEYKQNSIV